MRASTSLAIRSAVVVLGLSCVFGLAFGRGARAETPQEFNAAIASAHRPVWHFGTRTNPHFGSTQDLPHFRAKRPFHAPKKAIWAPPRILSESGLPPWIIFARQFLGSGNPTGIRAPWCAFFASMVLTHTGHRPLASGLAYSALSYGPRLAGPRVGALVVLRNHVGLIEAVSAGRFRMISGNWSHKVSLTDLPNRAAIAFVAVE